jgi:hypothetical protein
VRSTLQIQLRTSTHSLVVHALVPCPKRERLKLCGHAKTGPRRSGVWYEGFRAVGTCGRQWRQCRMPGGQRTTDSRYGSRQDDAQLSMNLIYTLRCVIYCPYAYLRLIRHRSTTTCTMYCTYMHSEYSQLKLYHPPRNIDSRIFGVRSSIFAIFPIFHPSSQISPSKLLSASISFHVLLSEWSWCLPKKAPAQMGIPDVDCTCWGLGSYIGSILHQVQLLLCAAHHHL